MRGRSWSARHRSATVVVAALVGATAGSAATPPAWFGDGLCALARGKCARPVVAVLSAFPAELEPLLARAAIRETMVAGDRVLRVGTLDRVPVVLGLLGIGFANAASTTRLVLDRFDVEAVVVSGVAGSPRRIADVTVPATWAGPDGVPYPADAAMLDIARSSSSGLALDRCTPVPPEPPGPTVCLGHDPAVFVGGAGETSDPYGPHPPACDPAGGDIFGCDVTSQDLAAGITAGVTEPEATDMESAAVAAEAAARKLPFIAFRAVSDGAGDPLGLPGFPAQFFAYYRLAARNAAAATAAFVARWGAGERIRAAGGRGADVARASCDWARRATAACTGRRPPGALTRRVRRACRALVAEPPAAVPAWQRAAQLAARRAARRRLGAACSDGLTGALLERATR
jgi:nucleoside phosphorylase